MPTLDTQNLVSGLPPNVPLQRLKVDRCHILQDILEVAEDNVAFGVSLRLAKNGRVDAVALATPTRVFQIAASSPPAGGPNPVVLAAILGHPRALLAGFHLPHIALILHSPFGAHIHGVDLSTLLSESTHKPDLPSQLARAALGSCSIRYDKINRLWDRDDNDSLCLRAWLSACIAEKTVATIRTSAKVDTRRLRPHELPCLAQLVLNVELVEATKPTAVDGEFVSTLKAGKEGLALVNARFKSRVRRSAKTVIEINGKVRARAFKSDGKRTDLAIMKGKVVGKVKSVRVIGREEATPAECRRDEHLLFLLQGVADIDQSESSFVRHLWFPGKRKCVSKKIRNAAMIKTAHEPSFQKLNDSQRRVASAMVGDVEPLVIAHGPPGTGKTTTIAAALKYWKAQDQPAWVVAHSNIGVKNIAETLIKRNVDFKLIVSHDFYFEWHEHHYVDISDRMFDTRTLDKHKDRVQTLLENSKIILCTLSMLSNSLLDDAAVFKHVPVKRLVVDEASQIDTFEFWHLFHKFKLLEKVCMFGDPKQLPPFGKEAASKMKTIFDFKHLEPSAYFLDTQYRMPVPLGRFISENVYKGKLQSKHDITSHGCIALIDVPKGREERVGTSWRNMEEVHTVVNIARQYHKLKRPYCVITPYDPQRAALTTALKNARLPHDVVYNVDSFQGHEADRVIISAVRTSAPGFLALQNRMNVMLTRCCKGMVVVAQRAFVEGRGRATLLGELAERWGAEVGAGAGGAWADAVDVMNGRARLPGCDG